MITQKGSTLELKTPYDTAFINAFKATIPAAGRKWDVKNKLWLVDSVHAAELARLLKVHFDVNITATITKPEPKTQLHKLEYLGACKDRGNEVSAFGFADGDWRLVFSQDVLKSWFEFGVKSDPMTASSFYSLLSIKRQAEPAEVKNAYRRLAKQWHPDVCREPNATEMFKRINAAYEVLSNPQQRRKYDAGLLLSAQVKSAPNTEPALYRAPLRCGWVLVVGVESLGRFVTQKILQWEDISDDWGRTMVSSWPAGADKFEVSWV